MDYRYRRHRIEYRVTHQPTIKKHLRQNVSDVFYSISFLTSKKLFELPHTGHASGTFVPTTM